MANHPDAIWLDESWDVLSAFRALVSSQQPVIGNL